MDKNYGKSYTPCCNNNWYRQCNSQQKNCISYNCQEPRNRTCDPKVAKGLVQSLKDKIVYLQNESTQCKFTKRPLKKKQKDYYYLMLRKINGLDRKLENLEDLFLTHLDRTSDDVLNAKNNDDNCEYLDFYDSVRSLINLVNKLKEDVVYKKNDINCDNQNSFQLYNQIHVLESELRNLCLYLDKLEAPDVDRKTNETSVLFCHKHKSRADSTPRKSFLPEREEIYSNGNQLTSSSKKDQINCKQLKSARNEQRCNSFIHNTQQHVHTVRNNNNQFPIRSQCLKCNVHSPRFSDPCDNNLSGNRFAKSTDYDCERQQHVSVCSCNMSKMNKEKLLRANKHQYTNARTKQATSPCSCHMLLNNTEKYEAYLEQQNDNHKIHFLNTLKHQTEDVECSNSQGNNIHHHAVEKISVQKKNSTKPNFQGSGNPYYEPRANINYHRRKQNNLPSRLPVKESGGYYFTESQYTSTDKIILKNVFQETPKQRIKRKVSKRKKNMKSPQVNQFSSDVKGRMLKNVVYYELSPKKENSKYKNVKKQFKDDTYFQHTLPKYRQYNQRYTYSQKEEQQRKYDNHYHRFHSSYYNVHDNILPFEYNDPTETDKEHWHHDYWESELSSTGSEEIVPRGKRYKQKDYIPLTVEKPFLKSTKQNMFENKSRKLKIERKTLMDHEGQPLQQVQNNNKGKLFPIHQHNRKDNKEHIWQDANINSSNLNLKYQNNIQFSRKRNNKYKSHMYESESYETIEEKENSSVSSSSNASNDRNPEELIILLKNKNLSSTFKDSDLGKVIDTLTNLKSDVCDKCIIREKEIHLSPNRLSHFKGKNKTKLIIKKEIIKCTNCRNKLEDKMLKISNKEGTDKVIKESKNVLESVDMKDDTLKHETVTPRTETNLKGNTLDKWQMNTVFPTFQAKLEQDNLFEREMKPNHSTEIPNFGNTININIDRGGSYSIENSQDKLVKSGYEGNTNNSKFLFSTNLQKKSNNEVESLKINNDYEAKANNKTKSKSNLVSAKHSYSMLRDLSIKKPDTAHNVFGSKDVTNNKQPTFQGANVIVKDNDQVEDNSNIQTSLIGKSMVNKVKYLDEGTEMSISSKTQVVNTVTMGKNKKDNPFMETSNTQLKQKDILTRSGHSKPIPQIIETKEISSDQEVILIPENKKLKVKGCLYPNKPSLYKPMSYKRNHTYSSINKKIKQHSNEKSRIKFTSSLTPARSKVFVNTISVANPCSKCVKHCSCQKSTTFNPGRRVSKQFKHRLAVYPRSSSKDTKLLKVIRKPTQAHGKQSFYNDIKVTLPNNLSKDEVYTNYQDVFNLTMTSESSFSILDWVNVAKKLKEERNYIC